MFRLVLFYCIFLHYVDKKKVRGFYLLVVGLEKKCFILTVFLDVPFFEE